METGTWRENPVRKLKYPDDHWTVAYHRIQYAEEQAKRGNVRRGCPCDDCKEYLGSIGLDTDGHEL